MKKAGKQTKPSIGMASLIRDNEIDRIPNAIADGAEDGIQIFNMALVPLVKQKSITAEIEEDMPEPFSPVCYLKEFFHE